MKKVKPPTVLYFGTSSCFLDTISNKGILCKENDYVGLYSNYKKAFSCGQKLGYPTVIVVLSKLMHELGHEFYLEDDGIWLTKSIQKKFLM